MIPSLQETHIGGAGGGRQNRKVIDYISGSGMWPTSWSSYRISSIFVDRWNYGSQYVFLDFSPRLLITRAQSIGNHVW